MISRYQTLCLSALRAIRAGLTMVASDPARVLTLCREVRAQGIGELSARLSEVSRYREWVELYDGIGHEEAEKIHAFLKTLPVKPKFSVLVPVYETAPKELAEMIASVKGQIYDNWELCIADDASQQPHIREILESEARGDPRIKLVFRKENGNISAASNSALALATGEFVVLLDHDDILAPHALALLADAISRNPDADILYSDEDKLDAQGHRYGAYFKPDWNPELLYGQNFISHLGVYRSALVRQLGGFRVGFEGSQDYDLALRATAASKGKIIHLPHILYHWRVYPGASTFTSTQIGRAVQSARQAIKEQLAGLGVEASVVEGGYNYHRVIRSEPTRWPKVTVVVSLGEPRHVLSACIRGLLEKTDYPDMEIIIVDCGGGARSTLPTKTLRKRNVQIVRGAKADFPKILNETARGASGEIVLFLDSDMLVVEDGWLKEMVLLARHPGIGAVGAQRRAADGKTWLGGMVLGLGQVAGPAHGRPASSPAYFGKLLLTQDVSCVSSACIAVPRAAFAEVGGFDESNLAPSFNDVELCMRLRKSGYRIVWTPYARLHHGKKRKPAASSEAQEMRGKEIAHIRARWGKMLDRDPFWNPNLSLHSNFPRISMPPQITRPWLTKVACQDRTARQKAS
ncbi:MAG: glycosyltransferase [Hyphomicrobiales bacterium]|nr:glycosyltransferase [Hyphomicrobiales bacterium]